jgi:uncharacterized protein
MITETLHRPWELPHRRWTLAMRWHDLLFMHWPVRSTLLRPLIPPALEIDTFDGTAWIGVVPFRMTGVRPRYTPILPWLSAFPELNVRTYVQTQGKPGVWFFSLDAANPVAVRAARWTFHLPYFDARITVAYSNGGVRYRSKRVHRGAFPAAFTGWYRPVGAVYQANPGTIDHWLTERYCLYAADRKSRLWRGDIHHHRWPLQPAEADVDTNTMLEPVGVKPPPTAPLLHFAQRLDVVAWPLTPVH